MAAFASVAHFLSVGVRLYNASRWQDAEPLLKRAFDQRKQFSIATQIECGRFYGLVCIKSKNRAEFDRVVQTMSLVAQSKSIADFLQGEWFRVVDRDWKKASDAFNRAWNDAKTKRDRNREEKILSP